MSVRRLGRYACTVVHAAGPRHTSTCRLELLSVGCWVHPLLGSGEPWQVCLVLSRLVFEMIQWLCRWALNITFVWSRDWGRSIGIFIQARTRHPSKNKCREGALPLDWVLIAARPCRCAHDKRLEADRRKLVWMSGLLHIGIGSLR